MTTTTELLKKLEQKKGERAQILNTIERLTKENINAKKQQLRHEKAREIVRLVGLETQQQLEFHISDITSLALSSVFENAYGVELEFVQRRNKTECDIWFVRDGNKIVPKDASGGGAVDVASFALRIASWSMRYPRSNNVIILDEPFKFLSLNHQEAASAMLKELSKKLKLQFIIITHSEVLASYADRVFETKIDKRGITKVTTYDK